MHARPRARSTHNPTSPTSMLAAPLACLNEEALEVSLAGKTPKKGAVVRSLAPSKEQPKPAGRWRTAQVQWR